MTTRHRGGQKGKPIDVSATTVFDLKAEVFRATDQFERDKRAAVATTKGYIPARKPTKKTKTVWTEQNRGVAARNAQDARATAEDAVNLENSRKALERKAQLYNKLQHDASTSDALLVDFERKRWEQPNDVTDASGSDASSDSEEAHDVHGATSTASDDPDAWVDYTDEFGRTRTVRRRDMPAVHRREEDATDDGAGLVSADMRREQERLRWEEEARAEVNKEIRTRGVGYYQFAQSEEERMQQMQKLNELRAETEQKRATHQSIRDKRRQQLAERTEKLREKRARYEETRDEAVIPMDPATAHAISDLVSSLRPSSSQRKQ
ncbi:hypothetical protein SYNPS1DRAFT_25773 [Syncephalis pseudoplumigaleata]|uniref:CCDC174 alpha/beta GRSR domain-containing protein n=1 Tax=Syncephalis pseudoplumigaleata TaxID=1712513 RepID=A0A4V1J0R4_9FUNG|nr:hypothetical protein SYNPS1DRAFT_25773 [Syncephalis pseudoplumigaleata]|eukprot:RKP22469.1 hypothetical protein SYNPS1DRAFT_25773 [Syncephalis pseudoplumigaleata]